MIQVLLLMVVAGEPETIKCIRVVDGDTIKVEGNVSVRLQGIDAPESKQEFGPESTAALKALCEGKTITLHSEGKDRYGRVIGVIVVQGLNCNKHQIQAGMAWHYKAYSKDKELAEAELDARKSKRGLWAAKTPQAPWDWRKRKR